jgi:hypothetical protein
MFNLMLVVREKQDVAKNHAWLTACGQVDPDVANVINFRTSSNVII